MLIYETLRSFQGTLALVTRHQARLQKTCAALALPCPDLEALLAPFCPSQGQDLRLVVVLNDRVEVTHSALPWWESFLYPEIWTVSCAEYQRPEPEKKLWDATKTRLREEAPTREVLLVDEENCIREGSMTNVFFVEKERLVTPPLEEVLPGIARGLIFEEAKRLGIELVERRVRREELDGFDAVFLSSSVRGMVRTQDGPLPPLMQALADGCTRFILQRIHEANQNHGYSQRHAG